MERNFHLIRIGCTPKVIYYPPSTEGHKNDYGNPVIELKGKFSKYIPLHPSSEIKEFRKIKLKKFPTSKRTLSPELLPQENKQKSFIKNNDYINKSHINRCISEKLSSKKICKYRNKTNPELVYALTTNYNKNKFNSYGNEINKKADQKKCSAKKIRDDYFSEIINLPGSLKRSENEIYDSVKGQKKGDFNIFGPGLTAMTNKIKNLEESNKSSFFNTKNLCSLIKKHKNQDKEDFIFSFYQKELKRGKKTVNSKAANYSNVSNEIFYPSKTNIRLNQRDINETNLPNDTYLTNYLLNFDSKKLVDTQDEGLKNPFIGNSNCIYYNGYNNYLKNVRKHEEFEEMNNKEENKYFPKTNRFLGNYQKIELNKKKISFDDTRSRKSYSLKTNYIRNHNNRNYISMNAS